MVTGIEIIESDFDSQISVYPNPTEGKLNIDLGQSYHNVSVTMRNLLGQIIASQHFGTIQQLSIYIDGPIGFYLLKLHTAYGRSATLKVIKEK